MDKPDDDAKSVVAAQVDAPTEEIVERKYVNCHVFIRAFDIDQHDLCFVCRSCCAASPCVLDSHWSAGEWEAFEKERSRRELVREAAKSSQKKKKQHKPWRNRGSGSK